MIVPRAPEQRLNPPSSLPQLDNLFTDDDSDDEVPVTHRQGTSASNNKLTTNDEVNNHHTSTNTKSPIEADDEEDNEEDTTSTIFLKDKCAKVDLKISSHGYHSAKSKILELIPDLYKKGLNVNNFQHLKDH